MYSSVCSKSDKEVFLESELTLKLHDELENSENYEIELFYKKNIKENSSLNLKDSNGDYIGWLIPANAIVSNAHDLSSDSHFLLAASYALNSILIKIQSGIWSEKLEVLDEDKVSLLSFLGEDAVVFIYKIDAFSKPFKSEMIPIDLLRNGYFYRESPYLEKTDYLLEIQHNPQMRITGKIRSENLSLSYDLIFELLNNNYPYQKNVVLRFFFLYQIIELLTDIVLLHDYKLFYSKLPNEINDPNELKKISEKLGNNTKQSGRINRLLNNYCSINMEVKTRLKSCCSIFLNMEDEPLEFADAIYSIRNSIFHGYAKLEKTDFDQQLSDICNELYTSLIDVIETFSLIDGSEEANT